MPSFRDTLELVLHADADGAINELKKFSSETERNVKSAESSLKRLSGTGLKVGAAGMGVGGLLTAMASGDIEAANQLKAAIGQVGQSYDEFSDKIDNAIDSQVRFGHTDEEVNGALTTLTLSYGDTNKALDEMQLVADLAARKHISLGDAATIVAKAHGGAGRVFKEFGIEVDTNTANTGRYDQALGELSQKLQGQASAAADTFGGKLKAIGAAAENFVSDIGQKYGPAILGISTGITALSGITQGYTAIVGKLKEAHAAAATAAEAQAAAEGSAGLAGALATAGAFALPLAAVLPLMKISLDGNAQSARETTSEMQAFADALKDTSGASDEAINKAIALNITNSHVFETVKQLGINVSQMAGEVRSASPDLLNLNDALRKTGDNTGSFADALRHARDSSDPFVQALISLHDAGKLNDSQFRDLVGNTVALGDELGAAKTEAKDLSDTQHGLGVETETTTTAVESYTDAIKRSRDAIKEADDVQKHYAATLKGTTDPFFALIDAADKQSKSQQDVMVKTKALDDAIRDHGRESDEARKAQDDLTQANQDAVKAASDLTQSQMDLESSVKNGSTSIDNAKVVLANWVTQGLITQGQADQVAGRLDNLKTQADDLNGTNVQIAVSIDATQAEATLLKLLEDTGNFAAIARETANAPGKSAADSNPLAGLPPGLDLSAPGAESPPGEAPGRVKSTAAVAPQQNFYITTPDPVEAAHVVAQHQRAAQYLGIR